MCALSSHSATYVLRGEKSSNSWRHFDNFATSAQAGDLQRRRHAAVVVYRSQTAHPNKAIASRENGPIDGYLRSGRTRVMSPVQARPHHLCFVLLMVKTLSPFDLAGNEYLIEFVRGLGVPHDPPSGPTVRDVLLDLCVYLTGGLRAEVSRLQRCYRDLPFFHLVTELLTERHGTGSYGSLVLRCVDLDDFSMTEFHLNVAPFSGRRDHINIKAWTQRFLNRFGVRDSDICYSTSGSGSNVKKAL